MDYSGRVLPPNIHFSLILLDCCWTPLGIYLFNVHSSESLSNACKSKFINELLRLQFGPSVLRKHRTRPLSAKGAQNTCKPASSISFLKFYACCQVSTVYFKKSLTANYLNEKVNHIPRGKEGTEMDVSWLWGRRHLRVSRRNGSNCC